MAARPVLLIAIAAGLSAAGALAVQPPPEEAPKERQICRGAARQLGSHIRTPRRCRTAVQWQQEDEEKSRLPPSLSVTEGQNDGRPSRPPT